MEINWQDIYYFTASFAMIVVFIAFIWLIRLFFIASKFINSFTKKAHQWNNVIDDVRYFKKSIKINILRFLLKIIGKVDKKI